MYAIHIDFVEFMIYAMRSNADRCSVKAHLQTINFIDNVLRYTRYNANSGFAEFLIEF